MKKFAVICHDFRTEISCDAAFYLRKDLYEASDSIRNACCSGTVTAPYIELEHSAMCCDALEDAGLNRHHTSGWDTGSYQAYVMGVAVVAILLCLFISGARSVRKRRMMILRERQRRCAEASAAFEPSLTNVVCADPPTYDELESYGLTKSVKGELSPPSYPQTPTQAHTSNGRIIVPCQQHDQNPNGVTESMESMEPPPYTPK